MLATARYKARTEPSSSQTPTLSDTIQEINNASRSDQQALRDRVRTLEAHSFLLHNNNSYRSLIASNIIVQSPVRLIEIMSRDSRIKETRIKYQRDRGVQ